MSDNLYSVWVYLAASPLFGLTLTLVAYQLAARLYRISHQNALLNPVLVAVVIASAVLAATGTNYRTYFEGAQFIHFMLGPATVALAVPLHRQLPQIRRAALPLLGAVMVGSLTAIMSAVAIAWVLGAADQTLLSLAPKSATAPVAMGISAELGGAPSLTAVFAILTGIVGALGGTVALNVLGVRDPEARGFAVGVVAHGIGTARMMQLHPSSGAFAGLGLALNAVVTAALVPLLFAVVPPLAALPAP